MDPSWSDDFNAHIFHCAVERVRRSFDAATWQTFQATWIDEQPPNQVAKRLRKPLSWVYKAKYRVLQRLRREVEYLGSEAAVLAK